MTRASLRGPAVAGLAALALAWLCVSVLGLPFVTDDVYPCGQTVYETESWSYSPQAWPPGALTCVIERRGGSVDRVTLTTWRGPASLLLFAASVFVLTLAVTRRSPRTAVVAAVIWLVSAAVAVDILAFVVG